ncbi:MAG: hypothetical protein P1P67_00780 [Treponema phagedenis]|uniref:Lipoprotein n=1 Tax=Treponema phagedenis TaxID=162 RepID=A0A0B7GXR7_TREPH|nr:hypothetical protein [Treponema phagedenis]QEJ94271.1 hypothetical protein FUT79_02970 [Treponema phagedenis]QSH95222.1 hypothetical protein C5O78_09310 [Treponema phagedenis]CEM62387.1 conserved exported hypothetical protein [Treponema phagedenis]
MKQKKIVSMIGMLVVLIGTLFMMTGCPNKPLGKPQYTKENFVLKFKNESGKKCYVEISGRSYSTETVIANGENWESSFDFPPVLKTEIPSDGTEKSITVKDVVVSGKSPNLSYFYNPRFTIKVISDSSMYRGKLEDFDSKSKTQYTGGTFHIKLDGNTFKLDFIN